MESCKKSIFAVMFKEMWNGVKAWMLVAGMAAYSMVLVACGDDSSSSSPQVAPDYCKIVSKDPFVMESFENGSYSKKTYRYEEEKLVEKVEFKESLAAKVACASYEDDDKYGNVICNSNSVVAIEKDKMSEREFRELLALYSTMCEDFSTDVSSSSSKGKSSSSVKSSSSGKSSSSNGSESSSSSEEPVEELFAWYSKSWYKKTKVVAANASELVCNSVVEVAELEGYDVAYEFNVPSDLGRDYLGKNHAYADEGLKPVSAECGSLVLNGTNGLLVPLSETFKNKGFVVEVRFMPTKKADLGNIFVAEPPGKGVDGWQIRLDGNMVVFYFRAAELDLGWEKQELGEVSLNEWHVVRVEISPSGSGTDNVLYSLNAYLDGDICIASESKGDLSNLEYGLGIGYDSMHQDAFSRKFFTGKIDYIRYGMISE